MITEATKKRRITAESKRLKEIFEIVDDDIRGVVEGLIDEVSFMKITLENLRAVINKDGVIDVMPQGEYSIRRQSPEVQTYNTMLSNYNKFLNALISLLPDDKASDVDDEFNNF